jgi:hypothetical protein
MLQMLPKFNATKTSMIFNATLANTTDATEENLQILRILFWAANPKNQSQGLTQDKSLDDYV